MQTEVTIAADSVNATTGDRIDPYFRVELLSCTPWPEQLTYAAMHQDYCEDFVYDDLVWMTQFKKDLCYPGKKVYESSGELIVKYLLAGNKGHHGPFEHAQIVLNVGWFPHSTMQQMRTHRLTSFDVQCLSGDSVVTFVNKNGQSSQKLKKTMTELYDLWTNGETAIRERLIRGRNGELPGSYRRDSKKRIKKMRVRSLNEETNTFVVNHIKDVVFNGFNPVYKVVLEDGKSLKCTQNHQIYTPYGWRLLGQLSVGMEVMLNGQPLANATTTYQNKDWLNEQFAKNLIPREVAAIAGCSTEAIKKWAYHHGIQWKKQPRQPGYTLNISEDERERRRNHGRQTTFKRVANGTMLSGEAHPSWKNLPIEKRVYNWLKYQSHRIIQEKGGQCFVCGTSKNLHVHHVKTVKVRPDLAFDENNMELLCASCHAIHHRKGTANPLCAHPAKIVSIEYVGVEPTYDLVMEDPHRNFVADGIVVHNSGRYTGQRILDVADGKRQLEEVFYLRPVGNYTDREGKKYYYSQSQREDDIAFVQMAVVRYTKRIQEGLSEEHARGIVPFDIRQHWVMSCNMRSLMHLLLIRCKKDAQLECQQLCELILPHFKEWAPSVYEWFMQNLWLKGRLAP